MAKKNKTQPQTQPTQTPSPRFVPRGGGGGGNPPPTPPRQPSMDDLLSAMSGRVVGTQEDDNDRLVMFGANGRPISAYTASAVDRRLQALSQQSAVATTTTSDLANARVQGRQEFLDSLAIARQICPQPTTVIQTAPSTPTPENFGFSGVVRDPKTGSRMTVWGNNLSQFSFEKSDPAYLAGNRLEKHGLPWGAWLTFGIVGTLVLVGLVWLIASLASAPSSSELKAANDRAAQLEMEKSAVASATRTFNVTATGPINANGAITATGAVTSTGNVQAGNVKANGAVTVNNEVIKTIRTTNVVHDIAPSVNVTVQPATPAPVEPPIVAPPVATTTDKVEDDTTKVPTSLTLKVKKSE